ncbi:MAG: aldo/keto reductase family protein [Myxococcota bacterium]
MSNQRVRLVQGVQVPAFLYGTAWKEERTTGLTQLALQAGFRGIDTANQRRHYFEAGVGEGISAELGKVVPQREDLFLQTKFTYLRGQDQRLPYDPNADVATQVAQSFESSLEHLRTTYVDSYVLHGPETSNGLTDSDHRVWAAMEQLHAAGKTRLLGVSNVSLRQLELLWRAARVKPAFVQNRCYASAGWDRGVRAFCREHSIGYQGFSLLTANARELKNPAIRAIQDRLAASMPQVVFSFALRVGMFPLTGTSNREHMQQDLAAFDLELRPAEVEAIENVAG